MPIKKYLDYKPRGEIRRLWKLHDPFVLAEGPANCVAGETVIDGQDLTIAELVARQIAPFVQTIYGPMQARIPFLKGRAWIYRLELEDGRFIECTAGHAVLTLCGWTHAGLLSPGMGLLSRSLLGGPRSSQTAQGSIPSYSNGHCLCGGPLPTAEADGPEVFPLSRGARVLVRGDSLPGDPASRSEHSPIYHEADRPSTGGGSRPSAGSHVARFHALSGVEQRAFCSCLLCGRSLIETPLPEPISELAHDALYTLRAALQRVPTAYSLAWDDDRVQLTRVARIESVRIADFYDLEVPSARHYFAHGILHHNTGKTRGIGEWMYGMCEQWPSCRCLIAKLTRKSLTESVIPTMETHVFPPGHPALGGASRTNRHSWSFPNGSVIVLGGLDDPSKRYSEEWDIIWVNEAFQISHDVYQQFFRGLRNKRILHPSGKPTKAYQLEGGAPDVAKIREHFNAGVFEKWKNQWPDGSPIWFHRIILDTNPDVPHHWLNVLANEGTLTRLVTRHTDNPTFSPQDQETLDKLTGVRRRRLRDGQWCAAEGQVWEEFDAFKHLVDDVPRDGHGEPAFDFYVLGQDWGFRAPGCLQLWGVTSEGIMYLVMEHYRQGKAIDWWCAAALEWNRTYKPLACVCDPEDQGSIDIYRRAGIPAIDAEKANKRTSLDQVRDRLTFQKRDGRAGLYILKGAEVERDQQLKATYQPCCTAEEIPGYVLRELKAGRGVDDETDPASPDHGCDTMRYVVRYVDRMHPSKAIVRSDALDQAESSRWTADDVPEEIRILERGSGRDSGTAPVRFPWDSR